MAAFGPDPIAAEKKPLDELAAEWSPAAAAVEAAMAVPAVPAGVSAAGAVWPAAAASGTPA